MKNLDPEDPFSLTGHAVALSAEEAEEHLIEMTDTIIHEFTLLGWTPERILGMFNNPFYRMPHEILRSRGASFVQSRMAAVTGIDLTELVTN